MNLFNRFPWKFYVFKCFKHKNRPNRFLRKIYAVKIQNYIYSRPRSNISTNILLAWENWTEIRKPLLTRHLKRAEFIYSVRNR